MSVRTYIHMSVVTCFSQMHAPTCMVLNMKMQSHIKFMHVIKFLAKSKMAAWQPYDVSFSITFSDLEGSKEGPTLCFDGLYLEP